MEAKYSTVLLICLYQWSLLFIYRLQQYCTRPFVAVNAFRSWRGGLYVLIPILVTEGYIQLLASTGPVLVVSKDIGHKTDEAIDVVFIVSPTWRQLWGSSGVPLHSHGGSAHPRLPRRLYAVYWRCSFVRLAVGHSLSKTGF